MGKFLTKVVDMTCITGKKRALNAARETVGKKCLDKEPSDSWWAKMLLAEHSPIRLVEYDWKFVDIKQWITVHLVRHFIGFIPFVHTQRQDRRELNNDYNVTDRDDLPQGSLNDMRCSANAQALINISRKRLCTCSSPETRKSWQLVREEIRKIDPVMADKMVPNCVYRNGLCTELKCCGYNKTEAFKKELENYVKTDY